MRNSKPSSQISVITSIVGGKDTPREEQTKGNADFLFYTDVPYKSKTWNVRKACDKFIDPRRNSRAPKLLSHQYCDTEYSIWLDGNMSLLDTPENLIEKYLKDTDIAVFNHTARDCIYEEATKCAVAGLDDPEILIEQAKTYENRGYGKNKGLCECGFIIRRHTPKVIQLNNFWWSEYCRHSVRDQISFMFAVDSIGIRVNVIKEHWYMSFDKSSAIKKDIVEMKPHLLANPVVPGSQVQDLTHLNPLYEK
jgi:Protein of unknown function (DUF616)